MLGKNRTLTVFILVNSVFLLMSWLTPLLTQETGWKLAGFNPPQPAQAGLNPARLVNASAAMPQSDSLTMILLFANSITAFAYASIPVTLIYFVSRRKDVPFSWVFVMFGAFILACGTTHAMHAISIWKRMDMNWQQAVADSLTAAISVISAVVIWPLMPKLLSLPSPEQLRAVNLELWSEKARLEQAQRELSRAYTEVEKRVQERTAELVQANNSLQAEIVERQHAEDQVQTSLFEKETLLRELHHRTKNNMGVIIALLDLQKAEIDDRRLKTAFEDTQNRIRSMALVHEKLYETRDLSRINLKEYILELADLLTNSYQITPGRVAILPDMENLFVLIDTVIPCGLIVNELISNALKYAFTDNRQGEIRLSLRRLENGEILLVVSDNGVGMPANFDVRRDGHMGLQTIFALAEHQMYGQVHFDTRQGVACQIQFRDDLYLQRV